MNDHAADPLKGMYFADWFVDDVYGFLEGGGEEAALREMAEGVGCKIAREGGKNGVMEVLEEAVGGYTGGEAKEQVKRR